jgi:hypothetical protein
LYWHAHSEAFPLVTADYRTGSYNPANQLLGMTYNGIGETRGYNVLNQLTSITDQLATAPYSVYESLTYNYPTGANNGKVTRCTMPSAAKR